MQAPQPLANNAIIKPIKKALQPQTTTLAPIACYKVFFRNGIFILVPLALAGSSILLYLDPSATFPRLFLPAAGKYNIIVDDTLGTIFAIGGGGANFGVTFFTSLALLQVTENFIIHHSWCEIFCQTLKHSFTTVPLATGASYFMASMSQATLFLTKQAVWGCTLGSNEPIWAFAIAIGAPIILRYIQNKLSCNNPQKVNRKKQKRFVKHLTNASIEHTTTALVHDAENPQNAIETAQQLVTSATNKLEQQENASKSRCSCCKKTALPFSLALIGALSNAGFISSLYSFVKEDYHWNVGETLAAVIFCSLAPVTLSWVWGYQMPKTAANTPSIASKLYPGSTRAVKVITALMCVFSWATAAYSLFQAALKHPPLLTFAILCGLIFVTVIGTIIFNLMANLLLSDQGVEIVGNSCGNTYKQYSIQHHKKLTAAIEKIEALPPDKFKDAYNELSNTSANTSVEKSTSPTPPANEKSLLLANSMFNQRETPDDFSAKHCCGIM